MKLYIFIAIFIITIFICESKTSVTTDGKTKKMKNGGTSNTGTVGIKHKSNDGKSTIHIQKSHTNKQTPRGSSGSQTTKLTGSHKLNENTKLTGSHSHTKNSGGREVTQSSVGVTHTKGDTTYSAKATKTNHNNGRESTRVHSRVDKKFDNKGSGFIYSSIDSDGNSEIGGGFEYTIKD